MSQLFETIKVKNKKLQNITYHNDRFNRSRHDLFGLKEPLNLEKLISLPSEIDPGIIKCRVTYDEKIRNIEFEPYTPKIIKYLKIVECNDIDYSYKYARRNRLNELLALRGDCDDILIIKNGLITDTSFSNIIFWKNGLWFTPSMSLLNGTQRQQLLDSGVVKEKVIKKEDLILFSRARLINAMLDLETSIDLPMPESIIL